MHLRQQLENIIETIPDFPKPGILFKDISPIFLHPELYSTIVNDFAAFSKGKIDAVCGIESRGYLFGIGIAAALNVPFILIRKQGKLPPPVFAQAYELEYGSAEIEMRTGQIQPGQRVLIHDDLLATGGTTEAAARLVQRQGAQTVQFSFLINLQSLNGIAKLQPFGAEVYSILSY